MKLPIKFLLVPVVLLAFDANAANSNFNHKGIPQGNQLFHPKNLLINHLKQTAIVELLKLDY